MKVYIVSVDEDDIIGVYSSLERAIEAFVASGGMPTLPSGEMHDVIMEWDVDGPDFNGAVVHPLGPRTARR